MHNPKLSRPITSEPFDRKRRACLTLLLAACAALAETSVHSAMTNLTFKAEASVKETFDSNVYLQDEDPAPANVAAAKAAGLTPVKANWSSFVTSILPKASLEYKPDPAFNLLASYAPDITWFHSASSENYVAHRGNLNFGGKLDETTWEFLNSAIVIDGSDQSLTFARPGEVTAIGGLPLRDRRDSIVFRNSFRVTQPLGEEWFIRPLAGAYLHDFRTEQRYTPPAERSKYIYENAIDRQEVSGGLDLGYKIHAGTHLILGYRYGQQDQFSGPYGRAGAVIDSPFDSTFHRVLVGVEGAPCKWLKLALLAGPDIREFSEDAMRQFAAITPSYATFQGDELLYYIDASITILPTDSDSIILKTTRYEQPAFSSFSMYEDIKSDFIWKHRCNEKLSSSVGFTIYIGDWQPPVRREDWVYTPNCSLSYALTKKLSAEASYAYDWVDSKVPTSVDPLSAGHEYTRHLATLGLRYGF